MSKKHDAVQITAFTDIAVDKLLFDPGNPRFGGKSESLTLPEIEKQQDRVQRLLEGDPHWALRLLESFKKNGFIRYEPLVVRQMDGKYVVIEGNRRLAAVRHIVKNTEGDFPAEIVAKFKKIPVLIFHQEEDHIKRLRKQLGELAVIIRSITAAGGDKRSKDLKTRYQEFSRAARQFLKSNA